VGVAAAAHAPAPPITAQISKKKTFFLSAEKEKE
jgi:hypothetical protein